MAVIRKVNSVIFTISKRPLTHLPTMRLKSRLPRSFTSFRASGVHQVMTHRLRRHKNKNYVVSDKRKSNGFDYSSTLRNNRPWRALSRKPVEGRRTKNTVKRLSFCHIPVRWRTQMHNSCAMRRGLNRCSQKAKGASSTDDDPLLAVRQLGQTSGNGGIQTPCCFQSASSALSLSTTRTG
jgi:hypothetical protein